MTNKETVTEVLFQMDFDSKFRVFFKNFERAPQIGKFVQTPDHEELMAKGFIRFVSDSKIAQYEEKMQANNIFTAVGFTRIMKLEEIKSIRKQ